MNNKKLSLAILSASMAGILLCPPPSIPLPDFPQKATDDGFEVGKIVAKNSAELKNNPNFIKLGTGTLDTVVDLDFITSDLREKNITYWLQPGTKVVVQRSNGSFTYGYVYIDGTSSKGNNFQVGIQTGPDKNSRKGINVGTYGPIETVTKYGKTKKYRSMTYDPSFWNALGYVHKSWIEKAGPGSYVVNPKTIIYKDAVTEEPKTETFVK